MGKRPSPTARTIAWYSDLGYTVDIVERRITSFVTRDLFGFIDLIAIRRDETLALQVTSASNVSARVKKINEHPLLPRVREAGWGILVVGWGPKDEPRIVDLS